METQEEFEQRKSDYIQKKVALANKLKDLVDKQDAVISEIAALRKPVKGPGKDFYRLQQEEQERVRRILYEGDEGSCDYYIVNGRIEPKPETRPTDSIFHGWLFDGTGIIQQEQSYLINKLINPKYKTEEEIEQNKRRKREGWSRSSYESDDSW